MERWGGTVSRGVVTEELSRQGPGAIRGKRLPSTRTSKHERPKPGAHLARSQTSKNTSLTGMLGKGTWEKWGQRGIRLGHTGHWDLTHQFWLLL